MSLLLRFSTENWRFIRSNSSASSITRLPPGPPPASRLALRGSWLPQPAGFEDRGAEGGGVAGQVVGGASDWRELFFVQVFRHARYVENCFCRTAAIVFSASNEAIAHSPIPRRLAQRFEERQHRRGEGRGRHGLSL